MTEELPIERKNTNSFTELVELNPNEINKKTHELLKIPIRLEHTYKYPSIKEAERELPVIEKIYQVKTHPNNYILTDSLEDRYFVGLTLSAKERMFVQEHQEEYDEYNSLTFTDTDPQKPRREIYRLNIEINNGGEVEKEEIEISYSREKTDNS